MMLLDSFYPILPNNKEAELWPSELCPLCCERCMGLAWLSPSCWALQQLIPNSDHLVRIGETLEFRIEAGKKPQTS